MYNCKYQFHPLSLKPGGSKLTFIYKSGKIEKTHDRVKYPNEYATKVINRYMCTSDPITFVISASTVIYEKNKC